MGSYLNCIKQDYSTIYLNRSVALSVSDSTFLEIENRSEIVFFLLLILPRNLL